MSVDHEDRKIELPDAIASETAREKAISQAMMAFEASRPRQGAAPKWWQGLGLARLGARPSLRMALVTGAALLVMVPIGTYMLKRQEALLSQGGTDIEAITQVQVERLRRPDDNQNVAQQAPATPTESAQDKTVLARPVAAPPPSPSAARDTRMMPGMIGGYSAENRYEASDAFGPRASQEIGRDKFSNAPQNAFKAVSQDPVSTFSLDVDTASYSYVRAALNQNLLPRPEAVRVEEMINYFPYDYAAPASAEEPFSTAATMMPNPWQPGHKLLRIGIKGYSLQAQERPAANLVFLIDTSGSMNEASKLPLLVKSLGMLVDTLRPEDKVSIVTYAGSAGVVLPPTKASDKTSILAALDRLQAGGSTAGGEGIRLAYQQAEANFDPKAVNRVLLATDGDFNVGITEPGELRGFVERERGKGIFLSVLGFGMGNLNDQMMQELAQNGNGVAAYIDTLNEARKVLVEEATSSLFPIAKDVKIQVEFNPTAVSDYRLIGYETRMLKTEDFNNDKVDAGDVGSGASVTAIYDVVPAGATRPVDGSRYQAAQPVLPSDKADEYAFVKIRYKLPESETSRLITTPVTHAGEAVTLAQASSDARFAVAVAGFGEWLRGGKYAGTLKPDDIIALAAGAKGDDPYGYRAEFVNLVRAAKTAKGLPQQP
ncbi:VWA domain-containing protein [Labrys neptuniae]|uniref:vWA domain-containing protein n=1 Tax=Labrys neptuniae TaxID=376174 RepID=UPI00288E0A9E|nr:VWA domain-containing protein [Labrys neptuniae]MDT3380811.1 VWA domain-containing protein [Labrys neptuniae]